MHLEDKLLGISINLICPVCITRTDDALHVMLECSYVYIMRMFQHSTHNIRTCECVCGLLYAIQRVNTGLDCRHCCSYAHAHERDNTSNAPPPRPPPSTPQRQLGASSCRGRVGALTQKYASQHIRTGGSYIAT